MSFVPIIEVRRTFAGPRVSDHWCEKGAVLTVTAQVSHFTRGTQAPYFSVTGWARSPLGRDIGGGAIGDFAVTLWPDLEVVERMHLANATDGSPSHAEANGFYWLAGALGGLGERYHGGNSQGNHGGEYRNPTPDECLAIFASLVRLPLDEARSVSQRLDQDTQSTARGSCPKCSDGLDERGAVCPDCAGTGRENVFRFARRRWHEECRDMAPRWLRDAREATRWLLDNASEAERGLFRSRCREYLGRTDALLPDFDGATR